MEKCSLKFKSSAATAQSQRALSRTTVFPSRTVTSVRNEHTVEKIPLHNTACLCKRKCSIEMTHSNFSLHYDTSHVPPKSALSSVAFCYSTEATPLCGTSRSPLRKSKESIAADSESKDTFAHCVTENSHFLLLSPTLFFGLLSVQIQESPLNFFLPAPFSSVVYSPSFSSISSSHRAYVLL